MRPPGIDIRLPVRGTEVKIRPITPADREIEAAFVRGLSPESRYARFHSGLRELTPELLARFPEVNYPDTFALIATVPVHGVETQIGVVRYAASPPGSDSAEVAIVVADDWQGSGIGTRLLRALRTVASEAGMRHLHMRVLPQNRRPGVSVLNLFRLTKAMDHGRSANPSAGRGRRTPGRLRAEAGGCRALPRSAPWPDRSLPDTGC